MDYKKIIKSRKLRLSLLKIFSFVPDQLMLKIQYRIKMGRTLNLKAPLRYTEKVQWYKLHYKNPLMIQCVDKYDVREFVASLGLESILNDCYGVFDDPEKIDFGNLPNQFVIKDTLGGGGNSIIICSDKLSIDLNQCRCQMHEWVKKKNTKGGGREWPYYSGKKNRIVVEKLLTQSSDRGLIDYKFMCFDGKVHYCYVLCDRILGESVKEGIFSRDFELLDVKEIGDSVPSHLGKPNNYEDMIHIAEILSASFPHVRVDLYDIDGKIVFGELTFYDSSGYASYEPDEFDYIMGDLFPLREWK